MAGLADDDRDARPRRDPGTIGFIGKFQLISALVSGDYTWLAIVLVIGSMISLGYYLRVVATIWMRPPVAVPVLASRGGPGPGPGELGAHRRRLDRDRVGRVGHVEGPGAAGASLRYIEVVVVAVAFAGATIFFGIFPSPLFHLATHAANALGLSF